MQTFDLPCYGPEYVEHEDVIDFWQTAISYYERLPTAKFLAAAGIVPSNTTSYTLSDIQAALTKQWGAVPYLGCSGSRFNSTKAGNGTSDNGRIVLDEVWYYMHILGKAQNMIYTPVNATAPDTTCATSDGAVWYYEMTPSSVQGYTNSSGASGPGSSSSTGAHSSTSSSAGSASSSSVHASASSSGPASTQTWANWV